MEDVKKNLKALKAAVENLTKSIDSMSAPADVAVEPKVKLTPLETLHKKLEATSEKLDKLNEKIEGGKSKNPDKDEEAKTKLDETIIELNVKISALEAKSKKTEAKAEVKSKAKAEEKTEVKAEVKPKAKAEEKTEAKAEVKSKAKAEAKNIPRMTPAMTTQLKAVLGSNGVTWDDKYKKEFLDEMNSLNDDEFSSETLEMKMTTFAKKFHSAAASGGGGAGSVTETLSIDFLQQQNNNFTEVGPGIYQHNKTGKMFTGPEAVADEGLDDATVDGVDYVIGENTQRVYTSDTEEFVGYWGVGKFYTKDM